MEANMPKVPPVMILAGLGWVVAQALAFGWIKHAPSQEVLSGAATVLAVGISWAEAHLRSNRVTALATVKAAQQVATTDPATVVTTQVPPTS